MSRAFTLIEIVITIALFIIVILGMSELYIVYGRVITAQQSVIKTALDGSTIMSTTQLAAQQAEGVIASHLFSGIQYDSGTTTAIFELPSYDSSGTILAGVYDYIGISSSGSNVYRITDAAPGSARESGTKLLTNALGEIRFTYDAPTFSSVTSVIVDATTTDVVRGQVVQTHRQGHFYLRNI